MNESTQSCRRCGETKGLDEFPIRSYRPERKKPDSLCYACHRLRDRARYPQRRESVIAYNRRYRIENREAIAERKALYGRANREAISERDRAYREANREKVSEYYREYRARNMERKLETNRLWHEANPGKKSEYRDKRRAAKRGGGGEPVDLQSLWDGFCGICSEPIDPEAKRPDLMSKSIDHIIPLSRGGSHVADNIQWTHLICNMRKGNRLAS